MSLDARWRKSSYSGLENCVEVARFGEHVMVRDSEAPEAGAQTYTRDQWTAFIDGVKAGEFDL